MFVGRWARRPLPGLKTRQGPALREGDLAAGAGWRSVGIREAPVGPAAVAVAAPAGGGVGLVDGGGLVHVVVALEGGGVNLVAEVGVQS